MLLVVSPFDQRYVLSALEVNTTLPPSQKVVGPFAVIDGFEVFPLVILTYLYMASFVLQSLEATTVRFPAVELVVTVMELVLSPEVIVQPEGTVHLYLVAFVTGGIE